MIKIHAGHLKEQLHKAAEHAARIEAVHKDKAAQIKPVTADREVTN